MKNLKRIILIVVILIGLAIIGNGIYLSQMGKTVDCAGVVSAVDTEKQTVTVTDSNEVEYLLKIEFYTTLKNLDDHKISIDDIAVGDSVTANYRGEWKDATTALRATYIKVAK